MIHTRSTLQRRSPLSYRFGLSAESDGLTDNGDDAGTDPPARAVVIARRSYKRRQSL